MMRGARGGASALAVAALAFTAGLGACGGNRAAPDGAAPGDTAGADAAAADAVAADDTVRGVAAVVGADPLTSVVVRTARGPVPLRGPTADTLRSLRGVEVEVSGTRTDEGLDVAGFRVRSVDGVPAVDGVLEIRGDVAVVVGEEGERGRFAPAPRALRQLDGRRVWVAGRPGDPPESWGLIEPED